MVERKHDNPDARDKRRQKILEMSVATIVAATSGTLLPMEQKPLKPESQTKRRPKNSIDLEIVFPDTDPSLSPNTVGFKINNLPKGVTIQKGFEGEIYSWQPAPKPRNNPKSDQEDSIGS